MREAPMTEQAKEYHQKVIISALQEWGASRTDNSAAVLLEHLGMLLRHGDKLIFPLQEGPAIATATFHHLTKVSPVGDEYRKAKSIDQLYTAWLVARSYQMVPTVMATEALGNIEMMMADMLHHSRDIVQKVIQVQPPMTPFLSKHYCNGAWVDLYQT